MGDVFATVWRKIDKAPPLEEMLPWLYRISYLVSSNHRKGYTRRNRLETRLRSKPESGAHSVAEQVVFRDDVRRVKDAMARLNPNDREILRLSVWEQLSNSEVAAVLGVSPEAAAQRLHRARSRLTRQFERLERRTARREGAS